MCKMPTADETFQKRWDTLWNTSKLNLIARIIQESGINKVLREENQQLRAKITEIETKVTVSVQGTPIVRHCEEGHRPDEAISGFW